MKKIITAILTIILLGLANTNVALASGGNPYGPYNPYTPHDPLPTGFGDTNIFYLVALVAFTTGMIILAIAKNLKEKQSVA